MADASALRERLITGANDTMRAAAQQVSDQLIESWNATVKHHTGDPHLPDTAVVEQVGDSPRISWRVAFTAPQGEWMENGTQPHAIFPREPGGVLHWVSEMGEDVFARYVLENSMPARPWFRPRLDEIWPGVVAENLDSASW